MAFHHVLLTLSEEPSKPRCVLSDLSAGQLEKQFLRPYRKGENILCGNQVIHITSIKRVQIIRTEMTSQYELSVIQDRSYKEVQEFNRQSDSFVIMSPGHGFDAEDIVEAGEDVTSRYIIGPPGHDATRTILKFFRNPWVVGICTSLIVAVLTELKFPGWFARIGEKVGWSSARPQPGAIMRPAPPGQKEQQPSDNQVKPKSERPVVPSYPPPRVKEFSAESVLYESPVPRREGNDVLIPLVILQTIPGFNENQPIYVATHRNKWLRSAGAQREDEIIKSSVLKREGDEWRAVDLAGTRFHPLQLIEPISKNKFSQNNFAYVPIENLPRIYGASWEKFRREFLDERPPTCFLVR